MTEPRYRVAIVGVGTESSTFSPHRTRLEDFTVLRGAELACRYPFLDGWRLPDCGDVEFVPLLRASALPGGAVTAGAYEQLEAELLGALRAAGPLAGIVLDLHGAMHVEGRLDAEAQLVGAVRADVGPSPLLSAAMDLHGQVSAELAAKVDLLTAYRTAPHVDQVDTRARACANLVHCLTRGVRPIRAWVRVPVLLPGEKTSTRLEPARSIYADVARVAARPGVIDAALWVGYAWADEPRSAAAVVVCGEDRAAVGDGAAELARAWWDGRDRFAFCAPAGSAEWAIDEALASPARPFFISDSGDNPTAGGSGDVAWFLGRLLGHRDLAAGRRTAIWASCVDAPAVAACVAAREGATIAIHVGGAYGGGDRVPLRGEVATIRRDDPAGGDIAVVRAGGVSAVLTSRRKPFHLVADFTDLGLDPSAHDLTAVKIGYLEPDLHRAAAGAVLALTPGGVDQQLTRLAYRRLIRPIHPLDPGMPEPDLTPVLFRSAP